MRSRTLLIGLLAWPSTGCISVDLLHHAVRADEIDSVEGAFCTVDGGVLVWMHGRLGGAWSAREHTLRIEPDLLMDRLPQVVLPRRVARKGWVSADVEGLESIPFEQLNLDDLESVDHLPRLPLHDGCSATLYWSSDTDFTAGDFFLIYVWDRAPEAPGQVVLSFEEDPGSLRIWPLLLLPPAMVLDLLIGLADLVSLWDDDVEPPDAYEPRIHTDGESAPMVETRPGKVRPRP